MMKPLLTAATCVLSLAALLESVPALAFETTDAVLVGSGIYEAFDFRVEERFFIFSDDRLNANAASGDDAFSYFEVEPVPMFATLVTYGDNTRYDGNKEYFNTFTSSTKNMGADPLNARLGYGVVVYHSLEGGVWVKKWSERYSVECWNCSEIGGDYVNAFYDYIDHDTANPNYVQYVRSNEFNEDPDSFVLDRYSYNTPTEGYHREHISDSGVERSNEPFDLDEVKSWIIRDLTFPEYGIFDFENSFVYYEGDEEGVSLAQIMAQALADPENNQSRLDFSYSLNDFDLEFLWNSDSKVTGMTLAYNLPAVPEPETYAMLLVGLGIVGAVTRRRRMKTATM